MGQRMAALRADLANLVAEDFVNPLLLLEPDVSVVDEEPTAYSIVDVSRWCRN